MSKKKVNKRDKKHDSDKDSMGENDTSEDADEGISHGNTGDRTYKEENSTTSNDCEVGTPHP